MEFRIGVSIVVKVWRQRLGGLVSPMGEIRRLWRLVRNEELGVGEGDSCGAAATAQM